jgi:hypothetical protein
LEKESQEVGHFSFVVFCLLGLALNGVENIELLVKLFRNVENRSNVTASVAVVRRGPHCNEIAVLEPVLKPIHNKLVSSCNQLQIIDMIEL